MKIVVTGAATGIGAETCRLLKERGDEVYAFDIKEPEKNFDFFHQIDLSDSKAIDDVVAKLDGSYDAILNIAGVPPQPGDSPLGNAVKVLAVNFVGLRHFTLGMLSTLNEGGAVVNVASRAGSQWRENIDQVKALLALSEDVGLEDFCAHHEIDYVRSYNLSKEAVIVWTMAQTELLLAKGLRMNTLSPGGVSTNIFEDFRQAFGTDRVDGVTKRIGRPGLPTEAAQAAIFLASPESSWIRGADIPMDGGGLALMTSDMLKLGEFSSQI
jgi:NAD(P)-dependent dehydrogenase (short-subunit alcohol dehydrogenase family)